MEGPVRRFVAFTLVVASAGVLAACAKNPTINIPPVPQNAFVTNAAFVGGTAGLAVYTQPLTAASTPNFTMGVANGIVGNPSGLAVSATQLFVESDGASSIYIFTLPVTPTSTPTAVLGPFPAWSNAYSMTLDPSGNLWVMSSGSNQLFEYSPPFATGVPAPTLVMGPATVPALNFPSGVVFDKQTGNMYVPNANANQVLVFAPPFTATEAASATMTVGAAGTRPIGIAIDIQRRLYVPDCGITGNIYVFKPPYATGVTPSFFIAPPVVSGHASSCAVGPAFDSAQNLYAPYETDGAFGNVSQFAPPFSAATTAVFSLSQPGGPIAVGFGL